ncbi:MAG TPA: flagellar basal body P-ring formation chaperone FlgA [Xanthobacteraceae bacterium]|nr:flagellar basal body P-ring formation chaperone FlgA [Xanthobacteraceae bacterium]
MTRRMTFAVIFAALLASTAPAAAQIHGATPSRGPALKPAVTVTGDIVRIGDLVENAGAVAEVPIFRAPDLGQTGNVTVASVLEAVRGQHLVGLDTRGLSAIAVTHAGRAITAKDIEARVLASLAGRYGLPSAADLAVVFDNPVRTVEVEATATDELAVTRLGYEPRTGRFDVDFDLPGSVVARRLPLHFTGIVTETFTAVVPTHEIAQGQVLRASDLAAERRPKAGQSATTLTAIEQAEGLTAKHSLVAGQVLHQADVAKPELVGRGDNVTIVFEVPGIALSVIGKANEAGALGDIINVVNLQSKHTIQATVVGPDRVSVSPAPSRLAENATR